MPKLNGGATTAIQWTRDSQTLITSSLDKTIKVLKPAAATSQ